MKRQQRESAQQELESARQQLAQMESLLAYYSDAFWRTDGR